jgi:ethanolamine permease
MSQQNAGNSVSYKNVGVDYFNQRQLKGNANAWLLWSLSVGAVIGGNFFGWNFGLGAAGFGGMAIASFLVAIMFICMAYCMSELSAALPHAGGFYSFVRNAFGPFWGFICGIAVIVEFILTTSTIIIGVSGYLKPIVPNIPVYLIWIIFYTIFLIINIRGSKPTFNVCLGLTLTGLVMLVVFYLVTLVSGDFKLALLFNIPADPGQSVWLPKGLPGVFAAIPFAIWFFLAIEVIPLAAEESDRPAINMPKAMITGIFTLCVFALCTLVINSGVGGGANVIGASDAPLADGLKGFANRNSILVVVTILAGLLATFHGAIFGYGRALFALSRAGYLPRWISITTKQNTPYIAIILGSGVGFLGAAVIESGGTSGAAGVLLNMSVIAAVVSYILVMVSYMKLKRDRPDLHRLYQSPLGIWGAIIGTGLALLALVACYSVPAYQPGFVGVFVFLIASSLFFFAYSKKRLIMQAPEEAAALSARS